MYLINHIWNKLHFVVQKRLYQTPQLIVILRMFSFIYIKIRRCFQIAENNYICTVADLRQSIQFQNQKMKNNEGGQITKPRRRLLYSQKEVCNSPLCKNHGCILYLGLVQLHFADLKFIKCLDAGAPHATVIHFMLLRCFRYEDSHVKDKTVSRILLLVRLDCSRRNKSTWWLLMSSVNASPGHRKPWQLRRGINIISTDEKYHCAHTSFKLSYAPSMSRRHWCKSWPFLKTSFSSYLTTKMNGLAQIVTFVVC